MQDGLAPLPFGIAQPLPFAYGHVGGMAMPQITQMPMMPGFPTTLSPVALTTPSLTAPALGGQVLLNQLGQPMQLMQHLQQPAVIAPTVMQAAQPTMLQSAQSPGLPAPPPPPVMQPGILQAQGLLQPGILQAQNSLLAQQYLLASVVQPQTFEQSAQAFDNAVASTPEPEVTKLVEHFKLDERMAKDLDSHMKRRKDTIDDDIKALYEILEGARNPAGLLRVKLREMEEGTFRGTATPDRDVEDLARKFNLDAQAAAKLAEVLSKREDRKKDIRQLQKHLELSNKPSSLVMMFLKDLRNGISIKDPEYPAAVGSYAHKRGVKRPPGRRSRSRSKSRRRRRRSSSSSSPPSEFLRRQAAKAAGEDGDASALAVKQASEEGTPRAMTLLERFG
mmetsp:Transcript_39134/g.62620  ORF Transcript_39134/g.62620 Transcript_39134/m.62620 type:complete len:392 (-) Transcript_39134:83-1258(-)